MMRAAANDSLRVDLLAAPSGAQPIAPVPRRVKKKPTLNIQPKQPPFASRSPAVGSSVPRRGDRGTGGYTPGGAVTPCYPGGGFESASTTSFSQSPGSGNKPRTPTTPSTPRAVCEEIGPTEFVTLLRMALENDDDSLLVIDVRSFFIYEKQHITSSVNVSLPRALTGKKPISLDRVESLISGDSGKSAFRDRKCRTCVVYDDVRESKGARPANALAKLLIDEGEASDVFLLEGGFANFCSLHPDYCDMEDALAEEEAGSPLILPLSRDANEEGLRILQRSDNMALNLPASEMRFVLEFDPPSEILPGMLYLGSDRNAANRDTLGTLQIQRILNMAKECNNHFPDKFSYKRIMINDDPDESLDPIMLEAIAYIDDAMESGAPLLVHCYMGVSRSTTVVLVYLMKYQNFTLQEAYDFVKKRRPKVCPNSGFMGHLIRYEKHLLGRCSLGSEEYAPLLMMYDEDSPTDGPSIGAVVDRPLRTVPLSSTCDLPLVSCTAPMDKLSDATLSPRTPHTPPGTERFAPACKNINLPPRPKGGRSGKKQQKKMRPRANLVFSLQLPEEDIPTTPKGADTMCFPTFSLPVAVANQPTSSHGSFPSTLDLDNDLPTSSHGSFPELDDHSSGGAFGAFGGGGGCTQDFSGGQTPLQATSFPDFSQDSFSGGGRTPVGDPVTFPAEEEGTASSMDYSEGRRSAFPLVMAAEAAVAEV